jgi:hypothetical protein
MAQALDQDAALAFFFYMRRSFLVNFGAFY